jgi:hypothetical protein
MTAQDEDRVVYIDHAGKAQCVSAKAVAKLPTSFDEALTTLCADIQLALDCIRLLGGVPIPVAEAILRNIEPAQAAIDMAVRCANATESEAN